ncbi:MAG: HAMP domain-containing histidine kinase [Planctomycetes bacterium]|nr:HAMP domain-containing histidine kinase [Planctomycetota bacterium]
MYSVRRRTTVALVLAVAAVMAGVGFAITAVLGDRMRDEFDSALATKARSLMALTDQERGRIELDYSPGAMPEFEREDAPEHFQFWLDDGQVLYRSSRLEHDLVDPASASNEPRWSDVTLPDGGIVRTVRIAFVPGVVHDVLDGGAPSVAPTRDPAPDASPDRGLVLAVARERGSLDRSLASLRGIAFSVAGLGAVIAAFLLWRGLSLAFRPIDALAARVATLDADALDTSIASDRVPRELAPITRQLDALLARLHESFARERRFTGNVAHELRTPIAELRTLSAMAERWPDDVDAVRAFFADVGGIAGQMERVVADLFLLARCQAGRESVARSPVDLAGAVRAVWSDLTRGRGPIDRELVVNVAPSTFVATDPGKFSILLRNLLDNARSHGIPRAPITCAAHVTREGLEIEITNPAVAIASDDLPRLTEPFFRNDAARSASDHAGLGLTLAAALTALLGNQLDLSQDADGIFRARVLGLRPTNAPPAPRTAAPVPVTTPSSRTGMP